MADDTKIPKEEKTVEVPQSLLETMQKQMAEFEQRDANREAELEGLRTAIAEGKGAESADIPALREKKTFEPKFRTVRISKYPMAGKFEDQGFVVGWTSRGAYQEVDRTGISPQLVDYIEIIFLGHERNKEGKLAAEKVRLLDFLNKREQVHCKILEVKRTPRIEPTGEEIDITVFDPQHGLVSTGDKIDGFVTFTDLKYIVKIPTVDQPVEIDGAFVN